jgi:hypothetical protein
MGTARQLGTTYHQMNPNNQFNVINRINGHQQLQNTTIPGQLRRFLK